MKIIFILIFVLLFCGCGGTKNLSILPELTVENRPLNKLIVDRKPDYGINGRDGCVVMEEISMDIVELNENTLSGKVFDSKTKEPLMNAQLTLTLKHSDSTEKKIFVSDSNGLYSGKLNGQLEKIRVEYIAYRDLIVDLRKR